MIRCQTHTQLVAVRLSCYVVSRHLVTSPSRHISSVKQLTSWDLEEFRELAFNAQVPARLPATRASIPPACHKWFVHDSKPAEDLDVSKPPQSSELRTSFWSDHESTTVPLELTTSSNDDSDAHSLPKKFIRTEAPLKLLLTYLSNNPSVQINNTPSIYLAQCDLTTLPASLQRDLPTPDLVLNSGKGDIYTSSLWLGRPPTYTPLHRDPNPNLFLQLAGRKLVRLLPPELGDAVFEDVQSQLASRGGTSSRFRGEEMMAGPERELLHQIVWEDGNGVTTYAREAELGPGDALFIPKGWWHSVKGVGDGVTASANWWFR